MGPQFGDPEITDPDFIENSGTSNFGVDAFLPVMRGFMGQLIATQLGQSIGALSVSITGSNDVAIPLFENPGARLIPQNVAAWGAGLEIPEQEIAIYLALREVSAQRLFAHTPWLSQYIRDLITAYGKGITVDIQSIQQQAETAMSSGELDITNPESINLAINQGMFQPEQSPAQAAALGKLEITLALIEGWIDHITTLSAAERLPSLSALQETQRRSRIESAPTQQLFASLLGLEVSPRKMRECANFWNEIYKISADSGIEIRDHRWEDPSLLPTSDDLADPAAFLASTTVPDDLSGLI
jgi:putative hydrolase